MLAQFQICGARDYLYAKYFQVKPQLPLAESFTFCFDYHKLKFRIEKWT